MEKGEFTKLGFWGVIIVIAVCLTSCGKSRITKICDIGTNPNKYAGKNVTIEGYAEHNLSEIQEYEKRKKEAEREGLRPLLIRPEEYSYIGIYGENIRAGMVYAKYETQFPESRKMVRCTGIIKLKDQYGNLMPVIIIKQWKYIKSPKQKEREKYKKHIIK